MLKDKMFQCVCHSVAQSGDTKYFLGWNKYETQIFNKFQLWKFSDLILHYYFQGTKETHDFIITGVRPEDSKR